MARSHDLEAEENCTHPTVDVDVAVDDGRTITSTVTTYCDDCGTVLSQETRR